MLFSSKPRSMFKLEISGIGRVGHFPPIKSPTNEVYTCYLFFRISIFAFKKYLECAWPQENQNWLPNIDLSSAQDWFRPDFGPKIKIWEIDNTCIPLFSVAGYLDFRFEAWISRSRACTSTRVLNWKAYPPAPRMYRRSLIFGQRLTG